MARDGSGTFNRTDGTRSGTTTWTKAKNAAVKIISIDHDLHDQDIADAITQSVSKDGQTVMTGNLNMGGNSITNYGASGSTVLESTTGTFTPNLYDVGGVWNHTVQLGEYTTIGDAVFCNIEIQAIRLSAIISNHVIRIEALPFASSQNGAGTIGLYSGISTTTGLLTPNVSGTTVITLAKDTTSGTPPVHDPIYVDTAVTIGDTVVIRMSINYIK